MKTYIRTAVLSAVAGLLLAAGLADAANRLTTRQMATTGTPAAVPAASASNGASDSVARVDHGHACTAASASAAGCLQPSDFQTFAGSWRSSNDGAGSGLDADKLDGKEPSALSVSYAAVAGEAAMLSFDHADCTGTSWPRGISATGSEVCEQLDLSADTAGALPLARLESAICNAAGSPAIPVWDSDAGGWSCPDYSLASIPGKATLTQLPLCEADGLVYKRTGGAMSCQADVDTDSLAALGVSCTSGHVPKWNGSAWECWPDSDTLGAVTCAAGEVPRYVDLGGGYGWDCVAPTTLPVSGANVSGSVASAQSCGTANNLTPPLTQCPAGQFARGIDVYGNADCYADQQGVTSVSGTAPIASSGGATPAISCATASSSQAGCLSSTDWTAFNGKEVPLVFGSGLWRAGNVITCINANAANEGCVSLLEQWFAGLKHFTSGVITNSVAAEAESSLSLSAPEGSVSIASGTDQLTSTPKPINLTPASGVVGLISTDKLYCPAPSARTFLFDLATATAGRATLRLTNSGNIENNYAADLDIAKGDLYTCSAKRLDCDGNATFATTSAGTLTASSWGAHAHTGSTSGGTLAIGTATTGTLAYNRGGTGLTTATAGTVLVGNGSGYTATDINGAWTTLTVPTGHSWVACTQPPQYRRDASGKVTLRGCVKSGARGWMVARLPTGYRPTQTAYGVVTSVGEMAYDYTPCGASVETNGNVVVSIAGTCDTTYGVFLDGISFYVD